LNEIKTNIGDLVCFCLHAQFPDLKETTKMKELEKIFTLNMGVVVSDEDRLGYVDVYSQEENKLVVVHKEFLKVLTYG
tara:strand:- start:45 stop:278 length:234 start_codon:yes stop_codon:yes gene_type:complete